MFATSTWCFKIEIILSHLVKKRSPYNLRRQCHDPHQATRSRHIALVKNVFLKVNKVQILPSGLVGLVTVCRVGRLTGVLTGGEAPSYNHCQSKSFVEIIAPFLINVGGRKSSSCNHSSKSKSSAATSVAKKPAQCASKEELY